MKANQKFRGGDDAVSPVIAVILMVAITVVLAATVYVWVSGFGSQSSNPAKTISLTSAGALASSGKTYTVAAASSGMKYSDISITINGAAYNQSIASTNGGVPGTGSCAAATAAAMGGADTSVWQACSGATVAATTAVISAGAQIQIANVNSGDTLRVLDATANSVILTIVIG